MVSARAYGVARVTGKPSTDLPWLIAGMGCYCGLICPVLVLTVRQVSARLADQKV